MTGFGVDLVVTELSRCLQELGHEVHAFTLRSEGSLEPAFKSITNLEARSLNPIWLQGIVSHHRLTNKSWLRHLDDFDHIITHGFPFYQLAQLFPKKTSLIDYGIPPPTLRNTRGRIYQHLYQRDFEKGLANSRRIIAISEYLASHYPQQSAKTRVVRLGNDHVVRVAELSDRDQLMWTDLKQRLSGSAYTISISRYDYLTNYKNLQLLVEAQSQLSSAKSNLRIVICGTGPAENRSLLESSGVVVVNAPSAALLTKLIQEARVLASPSQWEGFNLPIAEALAWGTPVLCLDIPAHREFKSKIVMREATEPAFIQRLVKANLETQSAPQLFRWNSVAQEFLKALA